VVYRFGEFELDVEAYELRQAGAPVAAEPKVLELLAYLVAAEGRVVSKEELLEKVWHGRIVGDAALSRAVREARRALGDAASESRWLRTVYGRGFAFVGESTAVEPAAPEVPARGAAAFALPAPLTTLIGRERELDAIAERLDSVRLLTLTGTGGTGKTRLALEAARRARDRFEHGVRFVALSEVASEAGWIAAMAAAVGVADRAGRSTFDSLREALANSHLLLVLDNFEQLVEAAPRLAELLRACPRLTALVTSRFVLRLEGEQELRVPPLDLTAAGEGPAAEAAAPAVTLFLERARAVRADFRPGPEELAEIAEICRGLDGLPLAIELAAARIKLLSVRHLRERLAERLDLLRGAERDRQERHRTLEAAFAWSYDLLAEEERTFFRRLAVFAGGFPLAAATAVCGEAEGDALALLGELADKSLIVAAPRTRVREERFALLETTRAFAYARLREAGEDGTYRDAHARWAAALAREGERELAGGNQDLWLRRLDDERANLLAALAWALEGGERATGLATGAALSRYWSARGAYLEGRRELEALIEGAPPEAAAERLDAQIALGMLCNMLCDFPAAAKNLEVAAESLRARDDRGRLAQSLNHLGWAAVQSTDLERAESISSEALALCRELGDVRGTSVALNNLGWVDFFRGDADAAEGRFRAALDLRREIGDQRGVAYLLVNAALTRLTWTDDEGEVDDWLRQARSIVDRLGDRPLAGWVRVVLANLQVRLGEASAALEMLADAERLARGTGSWDGVVWVQLFACDALRALGREREARLRLDEALRIARDIGSPWLEKAALDRLDELGA